MLRVQWGAVLASLLRHLPPTAIAAEELYVHMSDVITAFEMPATECKHGRLFIVPIYTTYGSGQSDLLDLRRVRVIRKAQIRAHSSKWGV